MRKMRDRIMADERNALLASSISPVVQAYEITATKEEADRLSRIREQVQKNIDAGLVQTHNISRADILFFTKFHTPFYKLAENFIAEQKGRGNAEQTIIHYEQSIRKMEKFFCWLTDETGAYEKMTNQQRYEKGSLEPYVIFEANGFEANYREFLLEEEGVSEQTVATYFRDYKAIAYYAMENDLIAKRAIKVKAVETDIKECYTDEEITKLLRRPKEDCSFAEYRNWVVVNWLLALGSRVNTIVNIKIKDIDFENETVAIKVQKNKRISHYPLERKLVKILREYIDEWLVDEDGSYLSDYLFPSAFLDCDKPMSRCSMGAAIAEYNRKRGVNKTSIHLFRHTFAKRWIMSDGNIYKLKEILGHRTLDMVTKYANIYGTELRPAIEEHSVLAQHEKKQNRGRLIKRKNHK